MTGVAMVATDGIRAFDEAMNTSRWVVVERLAFFPTSPVSTPLGALSRPWCCSLARAAASTCEVTRNLSVERLGMLIEFK